MHLMVNKIDIHRLKVVLWRIKVRLIMDKVGVSKLVLLGMLHLLIMIEQDARLSVCECGVILGNFIGRAISQIKRTPYQIKNIGH